MLQCACASTCVFGVHRPHGQMHQGMCDLTCLWVHVRVRICVCVNSAMCLCVLARVYSWVGTGTQQPEQGRNGRCQGTGHCLRRRARSRAPEPCLLHRRCTERPRSQESGPLISSE